MKKICLYSLLTLNILFASSKAFASSFFDGDINFYLGGRGTMSKNDYEVEIKTKSFLWGNSKDKVKLSGAKSNNFALIGGLESTYYRVEGEFYLLQNQRKAEKKQG